MRSSFTPEEVTQIEDKAYEVGLRIGKHEERERIIRVLATMRDTTHEDAWDTLDDAIDAINGVPQNNDTEEEPDFPFEYEGWN